MLGSHWSATIGGAQYQAKCIIDELVTSGEYDIFYLARDIDREFDPENYQIIEIGAGRDARRYPLFLDARALYTTLRSVNPDIVYQRVLNAYTGICAYYAKRHGKRMIWHIAHDDDVRHFSPSFRKSVAKKYVEHKFGQYGIRHATCVIAQTERQDALLLDNYGRKADAIIHNFHPLPSDNQIKGNPLKVVWVGNFKPMKRPDVFVRLAREMQGNPEVVFEMVGRSGSDKQFGSLLNEITELPNLKYHGELSISQVNRILDAADLFVNTSIAEGFPNTFIQAWMRKVPVLSLGVDVDGILASGNYGYRASTFIELKRALQNLVEDNDRRSSMASRAQELAFERFSPLNAQKIIALMQNCYVS